MGLLMLDGSTERVVLNFLGHIDLYRNNAQSRGV